MHETNDTTHPPLTTNHPATTKVTLDSIAAATPAASCTIPIPQRTTAKDHATQRVGETALARASKWNDPTAGTQVH